MAARSCSRQRQCQHCRSTECSYLLKIFVYRNSFWCVLRIHCYLVGIHTATAAGAVALKRSLRHEPAEKGVSRCRLKSGYHVACETDRYERKVVRGSSDVVRSRIPRLSFKRSRHAVSIRTAGQGKRACIRCSCFAGLHWILTGMFWTSSVNHGCQGFFSVTMPLVSRDVVHSSLPLYGTQASLSPL